MAPVRKDALFLGPDPFLLSHRFCQQILEPLETRLFETELGLFLGSCCPIEDQRLDEVDLQPHPAAHDPDETGEALRPRGQELRVVQEHVDEKPDPDLPLHRVLVVADEVRELERLLELLEEHLDVPPSAVELADRLRRPVEVVRQEHHVVLPAVQLHDREDSAQGLRVLLPRLVAGEDDDLVRDDVTRHLAALLHLVLQRAALPCHEERPPDLKPEQKAEVDVAPVREKDVARLEPRRQRGSPRRVVVVGAFHHDDRRKKARDVQQDVCLRRGLATPVLGPVYAVQHELDRRRVDGVDGLPESVEKPFGPAALVERLAVNRDVVSLKRGLHRPEQLLRHRRRTSPVRVRERVAVWWRDVAHVPELLLVHRTDIARLVQA